MILLSILLPVKSPVVSVVFRNDHFEAVLNKSVALFKIMIKKFLRHSIPRICLPLKCLLIFLPIFVPMFLLKDKNP